MRASHLSLPVSILSVPILQGLSMWFAAARSLAEPSSLMLCAEVHLCHGTSEGTIGEPEGSTWDTFEMRPPGGPGEVPQSVPIQFILRVWIFLVAPKQ